MWPKEKRSRPSADEYHGLYNHGATCYLNSVLQVLFMTEEFREAVKSFSDDSPDTEKVIDPHLKDLFHDLQRETTHTKKIIKALKIDRVYEQRDAAEYLEKILRQTSSKAAEIFHGQMVHRTTCSVCETDTETGGQFWHLPFDLVDSSSGNYSVEDGIEKYFKPSYFNGDNQMYCDKCDTKVDASSKYVIKHHPDVLILLLKRFDFSYHFMSYVKIKCDVDVPHTLKIPENQTYELYAVVDHFGDLRGGHYTATIKSQDDEDRWFSFDDTRVTSLSSPFTDDKNVAKFGSAYLLFYRKKDIQEKTEDRDNRKRPKGENENENDLVRKKAKHSTQYNTGNDTDTEDQEENRNLLSTTISTQTEDKNPQKSEQTETKEMRPDVDHDVQPGDSEISAVIPGQSEQNNMSDPHRLIINVITDKNKQTENSDSHEDMTSKDTDQDKDRGLPSTGDQTEVKDQDEAELADINQMTQDVKINLKPGDSERSPLPAGHDEVSHEHRKIISVTTDERKQTENSDNHENIISKDDDQEKDQKPDADHDVKPGNSEISAVSAGHDGQNNMSDAPGKSIDEKTKEMGKQHEAENMTGNNTDTDDQKEKLSTEGQNEIKASPIFSERSVVCERQGQADPQEVIIDVETGGKRIKQEAESPDPHEENMTSNNNKQEKDKNLLPSEDQNEVDPDKSELTESKETKPDVNPDVKPGDSKKSTEAVEIYKKGTRSDEDEVSLNENTEEKKPAGIRVEHEVENSGRSEQTVRVKEDDDEEVNQHLLSAGDRDVESGAERTRCIICIKCKIIAILAGLGILFLLIIFLIVFLKF
ncbi:probable ubiquitin carboxyl-terminal hydrolase creB isoform X10 [Kryptolebias marmoratus]|uniref:probable ubiquitin carboxyl-terminal hydrolase creB isoform X10 n=1 Tax=Kryptolebias marmoratus TaxID=37003 RepID=UPI0018ACB41B|nr:probable ubiquitin carboxyl-terminal hydrolase creB isoform X10 [Kryptolebias marmoratus]